MRRFGRACLSAAGGGCYAFPDSATYVAYADGTVYTLTGAYEAGVLTGPVRKRGILLAQYWMFLRLEMWISTVLSACRTLLPCGSFIVQGWGGAGTADCMDVNGDGSVTVSDVVTLRSRVVEG